MNRTSHPRPLRLSLLASSSIAAVTLAIGFLPATASATVGNHATCQFDVRADATPGMNSLTGLPPYPPETYQTQTLSGPMTCKGAAEGQNLPADPGTLTISGSDPTTPLGNLNSCAFNRIPINITVTWPGHLTLTGSGLFLSVGFDVVLQGQLGGTSFAARGGLGADPDRQTGTDCNTEHPFRYWEMTGDVALLGSQPSQGIDHQVAVFSPLGAVGLGFQYLGGGSLIVGDITNPNTSATLYTPTVKKGDTITFTSLDIHPHTVTSCSAADCDSHGPSVSLPAPVPQLVGSGTARYPRKDGTFDGDLKQTGDAYTIDTSQLAPGKYFYYCEFHPFMRGSFNLVP